MNVSLTHELEEMVQDKVRSGRYASASEVIREALRLLQESEQVRKLRLQELRRDIAVGVAQADRGEVAALDVKAIKAKARARQGARR